MGYRVEEMKNDVERDIITGLIVDSDFCREVYKMLKPQHFQSRSLRKVSDWVDEYYHKYGRAPLRDIQSTFALERDFMKEEEAELIEILLSDISDTYAESGHFNVDYYLDVTRKYLRSRNLEILRDKIDGCVAKGDLDKAEDLVRNYHDVSSETSLWIDPFDEDEIRKTYYDDFKDRLFRMPGLIGDLTGEIEREWLVGFLGPGKRGKCIADGTLITLPDGRLKPIEDVIRDRDPEILTLSESGEVVVSLISDYYENGTKHCFLVKTRTGREIEVTGNHPLLTPGGWKELSLLKIGDAIATPKKIPYFGCENLEEYKIRLLAYILAEGGVTKSQTTFSNGEIQIRDDFNYCVEMMGDKVRWKGIEGAITKANTSRKGLSGTDRLICCHRWLKEIDFKRGLTKEKEIPKIVFDLGKENLALFLATLFTCDGTIYRSGKEVGVGYCSSSKRMIFQVQSLLLKFGIFMLLRKKTINGKFTSYELAIKDRDNILRFIEQIGFLFSKGEKAQSFVPFVQSKIKRRSFLDKIPHEFLQGVHDDIVRSEKVIRDRSFWRQKSLKGLDDALRNGYSMNRQRIFEIGEMIGSERVKNLASSDILWEEIKEISPVGLKKTYDLTVEKEHNFIANNIFVHNSWYLQDMDVEALTNGLKVAHFSLEMNAKNVKQRVYAKMTTGVKPKYVGPVVYPVFDCVNNQNGSCDFIERKNEIFLYRGDQEPPRFDMKNPAHIMYRTCTFCRKKRLPNYIPAVWYEIHDAKEIGSEMVINKVRDFKRLFSANFRVISYPPFGRSMLEMRRDLDELIKTGFVPDFTAIDYIDITAPEKGTLSERGQVDTKWKMAKGWAKEYHMGVASVSQSGRGSFDKADLDESDISEDIRKIAHGDIWYGLNQTREEKEKGIMRISIMAYRHDEFSILRKITVLQSLKLGQPFLDSEYDAKTYGKMYGTVVEGDVEQPQPQQQRRRQGGARQARR